MSKCTAVLDAKKVESITLEDSSESLNADTESLD